MAWAKAGTLVACIVGTRKKQSEKVLLPCQRRCASGGRMAKEVLGQSSMPPAFAIKWRTDGADAPPFMGAHVIEKTDPLAGDIQGYPLQHQSETKKKNQPIKKETSKKETNKKRAARRSDSSQTANMSCLGAHATRRAILYSKPLPPARDHRGCEIPFSGWSRSNQVLYTQPCELPRPAVGMTISGDIASIPAPTHVGPFQVFAHAIV